MENLNNIYEWHVKDADMVNILNKIDRLEKENRELRKELNKYLLKYLFKKEKTKGEKDVK